MKKVHVYVQTTFEWVFFAEEAVAFTFNFIFTFVMMRSNLSEELDFGYCFCETKI